MTLRTSKFTLIAVFVLTLGALSSVVGYIVKHRYERHERAHAQASNGQASTKWTPYVMVSKQTLFKGDGMPGLLVGNIVRYRRSDGSYKQVTTIYKADGSVDEFSPHVLVGVADLGVYNVGKEQLSFISGLHGAPHGPTSQEQHPAYSHDDVILGHRVQVLRYNEPDNTYTEFSIAPELFGDPIKFVSTSSDGARTVVEAVTIELREPTASEFGELPNYAIDYSSYERLIEKAEASGRPNEVKEMRRILAEAKRKSQPAPQ
jgi:hypothetical protein